MLTHTNPQIPHAESAAHAHNTNVPGTLAQARACYKLLSVKVPPTEPERTMCVRCDGTGVRGVFDTRCVYCAGSGTVAVVLDSDDEKLDVVQHAPVQDPLVNTQDRGNHNHHQCACVSMRSAGQGRPP